MISSLFANKDRYTINFANSLYAEYKHLRYGLKTCVPTGKLWLDQLRYDLLEYGGETDFCNVCTDVDLSKVVIYYPGSKGSSCNIIQENKTFIYTQPCNDPKTVWTITHNLGYVPNVFIEDCTGCDIEGVITVLNNSTIIITFSSAVAGKAYLS